MLFTRYRAWILLLAALLLSFAVSRMSDQFNSYYLDIVLTAGISIILAVSLNLVNGHTGQFSLGHAGLMAVGAYGSAVVSLQLGPQLQNIFGTGEFGQGLAFLTALLTGGIAAAVFGWMIGVPSLRLRGDYLAIVTLGFNEIIRVLLQNTQPEGTFGGALGLGGIPFSTTLFWVFGAAAVCIYVVTCMVNSTWGRGFLAVRDDEIAASAMGISTTRYKVTAFVVGAFFAGIGGGLYAHQKGAINPEGFNFLKSFDVVVIVILGGMGSTVGVIAAAIILTLLNEYLRDFEEYRMIVFSLLLIFMMLVRPQGLLPATLFEKKGRTA
jgi:branched-chain amino acid transport system permease protein